MYQAYRPTDCTVDLILVEGVRAVTLGDSHSEQRATGRIISTRVAGFHRFQEGLLVEYRDFTDSFDAAEQVPGRELDL